MKDERKRIKKKKKLEKRCKEYMVIGRETLRERGRNTRTQRERKEGKRDEEMNGGMKGERD